MRHRAWCLTRLLRPRAGQTNVELGAILVFVSIAAVGLLVLIGDGVMPMFNSMAAGF